MATTVKELGFASNKVYQPSPKWHAEKGFLIMLPNVKRLPRAFLLVAC